jgi:diaminopimelate epimerase
LERSLRLDRSFFKAHGHGNDYLVFREGGAWAVTPEAVETVCHRQRGVGSDGIVVLLGPWDEDPPPSGASPFRLRMFNPDGSEFERSGNGLRVLGAYLVCQGWVGMGEVFSVEVGGDRLGMEVMGKEAGGLLQVGVDMGVARFGLAAVGGAGEGEGEGEDSSLLLQGPRGELLDVQPVSVGNPHCVVFRDRLPEEDLLALGPFLTKHPVFPKGVNVQLARLTGEREVSILIWERGVGRTTASGTSSCAVAAAFVRRGLIPPGEVAVEMEGGRFSVVVSPNGPVRLEGPVQPLMTGELAPELLEALASPQGDSPQRIRMPSS